MTDIVLVAGAGGVGKTTLAAGIGVAAALEGRRTLVLTVDPARRLATALGLKKLSNVAHPNPDLDTLVGGHARCRRVVGGDRTSSRAA